MNGDDIIKVKMDLEFLNSQPLERQVRFIYKPIERKEWVDYNRNTSMEVLCQ